MITASYNPPEFNGVKCISADGTECITEEEKSIENAFVSKEEITVWIKRNKNNDYFNSILKEIDC